MNNRRLSYGILLTLAAAFLPACGGDNPPPEMPANTAAPEPAPPPASAEAAAPPPEPKKEEPPPPPAKPAKEKFQGKFAEDFSGDVKDAADKHAKTVAGKNDKDNKKYNAEMAKAEAAAKTNTLENTGDMFVWNLKGKPVHKVHYEVANSTDNNLSIKLGKDDQTKKDYKGQQVDVTFTDDNTFSMKDPFAPAGKGVTLVFKRQ
ncbi:MAG TPA: hypothetical protein VHB21_12495 [Minicystis sp.]|nr:hypothetical protein [Minicystis sp.]